MAKKRRKSRRTGKRKSTRRKARRTVKRRKSGGGKRRKARRTKRKSSRRKARRTKRRKSPRRKARRTKRRKASRRKARRTKRRKTSRRKARRTRRRKTSRGKSRRTRARGSATIVMRRGPGGTLMMNPTRRRKRRKSRRTVSRSRRAHRRYGKRHYRKNPGNMLIDLAKQAAPILIGLYGARLFVSKIGPRIPGVSMLPASIQGPVLSIGTVLLVNYTTKKVAKLAKYRNALMLGAGLAALDSLIKSFAPASVKALIGVGDAYESMGEYVQMGEYMSVAGADPIDDDIAMSDYIAVGSDGVEEELGMGAFEELGAYEELGDDNLLGGVSQSSMLRQIPTKQFLQPVPARSFTRQIPSATENFDNPGRLYTGIFAGSSLR